MEREIFRHIRPQYFDVDSISIKNRANGGISFLIKPSEIKNEFVFWVYICPDDAEFSSRQAVKSLRKAAKSGIVPRGQFTMGFDTIIDQLSAAMIESERTTLPSEATQILSKIALNNVLMEMKLNEAKKNY